MSESETPAPRPVPRPVPHSAAPSPAVLAARPSDAAPLVPVAPPVVEHDESAIAEAMTHATVAEDGTITVQDGTQVRGVGTTQGSESAEAAIRPLAVAYLDIAAFLDTAAARLDAPSHTQVDLNRILEQLRKNLKEPKVVGDIPALRARSGELRDRAKGLIQKLEAERTKARDEAAARRTAFVEEIEALVAQDPSRISWKSAGETMRQMVPTWKAMQKEDVALDRPTEDALWKRLSAARGTFDRARRHFFSQLDEQHVEAERTKEALIARAVSLQDSTDWGPTVREFRALMDEWRQAPRGNRKKDDQQWARFKTAQDTFFSARNADLQAADAEQRENLKAKEQLLTEAEALLPVADHKKAVEALRRIQGRWEDAGRVPRADMRRIEDRLHAVERAVKQAEDDEWRRTDPRTKARVEGASSQLQAAIASYEEDLANAEASGDPRRIEKARAALEARKEWLAVIERSARDLS